ncbi:MAG: hypothetical protein EPO31_13875 [Gammaproteobacteria bacterium]|nr:MAG: hypothetical protein EPO31_13875 [Gammaproteobacteria bacterium]
MRDIPRWILLVLHYAVFAALIGFFSTRPVYRQLGPDLALIKLSFGHAGMHKEDCHKLTPEELAKLAANMRQPVSCKRERVPLLVELELDGEVILRQSLPPSGIAGDGESTIYHRIEVPAGQHDLTARLRDSRREEGFDYESAARVELAPEQNYVIDFRAESGGFIFP